MERKHLSWVYFHPDTDQPIVPQLSLFRPQCPPNPTSCPTIWDSHSESHICRWNRHKGRYLAVQNSLLLLLWLTKLILLAQVQSFIVFKQLVTVYLCYTSCYVCLELHVSSDQWERFEAFFLPAWGCQRSEDSHWSSWSVQRVITIEIAFCCSPCFYIVSMLILLIFLTFRYGFVTFETQEDAQKILQEVS